MVDPEEPLEVVNERGEVVGVARRSEIHGNPSLIHRVVHVLVFDEAGRLLLQKRSMNKDVAPGKWDTSVGGHVGAGEDLTAAARRELEEELGPDVCGHLQYLYSYMYRDRHETELVATYLCVAEGDIFFNRYDIDEVRFWSLKEIRAAAGKGIFSSHFEDELRNYLSHTPRASGP